MTLYNKLNNKIEQLQKFKVTLRRDSGWFDDFTRILEAIIIFLIDVSMIMFSNGVFIGMNPKYFFRYIKLIKAVIKLINNI